MKARPVINLSPPATITRNSLRRAGATKRLFRRGLFCGTLALTALACVVFSLPSAAALRNLRRAGRPAAPANVQRSAVGPNTKSERAPAAGQVRPQQLLPGLFPALLQAQPPPAIETIATFDATCTTPQTVFNLGETICAKVTNAPTYPLFALRRISWVNTGGLILQQSNVNGANDSVTFTLPTELTSAEGLDRRGGWAVNSVSTADSSVHAQARFTVKSPTAPAANLSVFHYAQGGEAVVAAGAHIVYTVIVANDGPDDAQNVQLTEGDPTLSNGAATTPTFLSRAQLSGPAFTCAGDQNCAIATLPAGAVATFAFTFDTAPNTPQYTVITNTASVTDATADPRSSDNSSDAFAAVIGTSTAADCVLACPNDMTVTANTTQGGTAGAVVTFGASEPSGSCGTVSTSPASGSFFPVGTTTVTSTSSQGGGLCSFNITVLEAGGPTISCPANVAQTIIDGCAATIDPGTPTASNGATVTADRSDDKPLSEPFPVGTTSIVWTATDSAGRTASCTQTVTVNIDDTELPTITAPPDVTVTTGPDGATCGVIISDAILGQPTANDNGCSVSVSNTGVPAGNFFPLGTTTITWKATDASGNMATATQHVTVSDDTPPIIYAPANATYTCLSEVPAANPAQATGPDVNDQPGPPADNCGVPVVTVSETSSGAGSTASPRIITRTFTATDSHGNHTDAVQTITVIDGTAPTISAPANVTVNTGAGASSCSAVVSDAQLGTATANDNCAGVNVTRSGVPAGNVFPKGTTTVTYTATDAAGNTATATQAVTVNDTTPPVITVNGANPLTVECHTTFSDPGATANDACDGARVVTSSNNVNANVPGSYTVNYSTQDAAGNPATATRTVNVVDTTLPTITTNGQTPSMWPPNHKYQTFTVTNFVTGASDSCNTSLGVSNVVIEKVTSDETTSDGMIIAADCKSVQLRSERDGGGDGRVYIITFKVRDAAGNIGRATARVVVPHDQGGGAAVDSGVHSTVNGSCP